MRIERFVVIGDSCAEGIDDPYPDGTYRGWADLVARRLAARQADLTYANLAVRGRRLDQIHDEQLLTACCLRPDLAALFGGGNDVLQGSRWDAGRVRAVLDDTVGRLAEVAGTVLLFTLPETRWQRLGPRRIKRRAVQLNQAIVDTAGRYHAMLVDLRDDDAVTDNRYFGADRLHLSDRGHQRLAAHVLRRLGVPPTEEWAQPLPAAAPVSRLQRAAGDLRWLREYAAPAAYTLARNRIVGRQPGDGFTPKRPDLRPVTDPH